MRILIIQERGRHAANREFREALCLKRGVERAGHECIVWGLNYENFSVPFDEISRGCNAVLSLENYDTGWHPDISTFGGVKLFWSIDSHCAMANHQRHCTKHKFDVLLMSNIHHADYFRNLVGETEWFPNGYPSDLIKPNEKVSRSFDVGFCGSLIGNRESWLNLIGERFSLKRDIFKIGSEMVDAMSSYKIAFNINIADDVNFRTFEATGAGALLLTNYTPNLEKLFKINEEIVIYRSPEELLDLIDHFVRNDEEREKISKLGLLRSANHHSYDVRSRQLIDILEK